MISPHIMNTYIFEYTEITGNSCKQEDLTENKTTWPEDFLCIPAPSTSRSGTYNHAIESHTKRASSFLQQICTSEAHPPAAPKEAHATRRDAQPGALRKEAPPGVQGHRWDAVGRRSGLRHRGGCGESRDGEGIHEEGCDPRKLGGEDDPET